MQPQDTENPRIGGLIPSQGIEWSMIWLAVGVLGMVFLFFAILGTKSDTQPSYENQNQITPRSLQDSPQRSNEPEIGTTQDTESA